MIEAEHTEICEADKLHPINTDPLPTAAPRFTATHTLEFDPRTRTYPPVPKVPQHERGDLP